jgi:hypothetical protein
MTLRFGRHPAIRSGSEIKAPLRFGKAAALIRMSIGKRPRDIREESR